MITYSLIINVGRDLILFWQAKDFFYENRGRKREKKNITIVSEKSGKKIITLLILSQKINSSDAGHTPPHISCVDDVIRPLELKIWPHTIHKII